MLKIARSRNRRRLGRRRARQQQVLGHEQHDADGAQRRRRAPHHLAVEPRDPPGRPQLDLEPAFEPAVHDLRAAGARRPSLRPPRRIRSSACDVRNERSDRQVVGRLDDVGLALAVVAVEHRQPLARHQRQRLEVPPPLGAVSSRMRTGERAADLRLSEPHRHDDADVVAAVGRPHHGRVQLARQLDAHLGRLDLRRAGR